jgi:hypothetical protein
MFYFLGIIPGNELGGSERESRCNKKRQDQHKGYGYSQYSELLGCKQPAHTHIVKIIDSSRNNKNRDHYEAVF